MDPALVDLLEPVVAFATILGIAFGVKLLIWGKGPIRQIRRGAASPEQEQRLAELEERMERLAEQMMRQADRLEDHDERLDFTERMLTRHRAEEPRALRDPEPLA
jgi:hypothetical protein